MYGREELEEFEQTIDGEHYYVCAEVNKVMDAYEARIRELEEEVKVLKETAPCYGEM